MGVIPVFQALDATRKNFEFVRTQPEIEPLIVCEGELSFDGSGDRDSDAVQELGIRRRAAPGLRVEHCTLLCPGGDLSQLISELVQRVNSVEKHRGTSAWIVKDAHL